MTNFFIFKLNMHKKNNSNCVKKMHMKFLKFSLAFILLLVILSPTFLSQAEARCESKNLSENTYNQSRPRISVNGEVVHVVWEDNRQGSKILYRRSTDGGNT